MSIDPKLGELSQYMQKKVDAVLRDLEGHGWEPNIAEGRRTVEQQRQKVKDKVSKTMKSKHLEGNAADIIDKRHGWSSSCPKLFWIHLASSAIAHGLKSGIFFGLAPKPRAALLKAIADRDFEAAAKMPFGWDVAHVEK